MGRRRRAVIMAAGVVAILLALVAAPAPAQAPAPVPNGENAAATATLVAFFPRTGRRRLLVARSSRGVTVRARLVDLGGAGIRGALVDARTVVMAPWARSVTLPALRTGPDGSFAVRVASMTVSRRLHLAYRSDLTQWGVAAAADVMLRVRAALTLRLDRHVVLRGGTLRFAGRLRGRLPRHGRVVELQARDRGARRWLTFRTLRVRDPRGRFRARHTFRRTRGRLRLEFRARARADGASPFATGASRPVGALVR